MFTNENSELFCELALEDALRIQASKVKGHVYSISSEEFRRRPNESLIEGVVRTLDIEQLVFFTERRDTDTEMIMLSRSEPGYRITVSVPYTGERRLWFFKPHDHKSHFPKGQINAKGPLDGGVIKLIAQRSSHLDLAPLNQAIESEIAEIDHFVRLQRKQIKAWRIQLAAAARQEVMERREALGDAPEGPEAIDTIDQTDQMAQEDGLPDSTPATQVAEEALTSEPGSQIALEPSKKVVQGNKDPSWPSTAVAVVENQTKIFEELSQIYAQHTDGELRNILLAQLTHTTPATPTAETVQAAGKVNFFLPGANGAKLSPFVGGCMTWKGPAALRKKCDQLLKISGGKDATTVLVVLFRRSGDFNRVLDKVPNTLKKHSRFKHEAASTGERDCRFVMSSPTDGESEIAVHAISINLPPVDA